MEFPLQFNCLRKGVNLQWKRRLHASANTLSYESAAFNQCDKSISDSTDDFARSKQTKFLGALGSFQELSQRLTLVKSDKADIVTHEQPPSSNPDEHA